MTRIATLLAIGSATALAGCATVADTVGESYNTALVGSQEVPGPGDPDGSGTAKVTADSTTNQVCYDITTQAVTRPNAAHLHEGAMGVDGPVRVTFDPPVDGSSKGCVKVDRQLAAAVIANPANFYVNVHNAQYPKGAIRGQLAR